MKSKVFLSEHLRERSIKTIVAQLVKKKKTGVGFAKGETCTVTKTCSVIKVQSNEVQYS